MTADEIFTTTGFDRADSEKLAASLADAPVVAVNGFRAMLKSGVYTADEMVERIGALRALAR